MPEGVAVAGAAQNAAGGSTIRNVSKFPLSYSFYNTERFGEYVPFFVEEGVARDKLPFHSSHEVNTYTLKAPLLQSILKKKDYFAVPMQAILPLNWDKFYTNPVIGQDVPTDSGLGVDQFWNKIEKLHKLSKVKLLTDINLATPDAAVITTEVIQYLVFFEYFYSTGSLLKCLNISGNAYFHCNYKNRVATFDDMFDSIITILTQQLISINVSVGGQSYLVRTDDDYSGLHNQPQWIITTREFLELVRDDLATFSVSSVTYNTGKDVNSLTTALDTAFTDYAVFPVLNNSSNVAIDDDHKVPLNLGRLWAYQLVVAHFYSNDHVDFIYSADLFRQYIRQVASNNVASTNMAVPSFTVNGLEYEYDALSAKVFTAIFSGFGTAGIFSFTSTYSSSGSLSEAFAYFTALFHYKHSLRYMDYFTGARSLPLAIGDHEVDVNSSNKVDVLDMARGRLMTKFLQSVNRAGRKFGNYMKELFGVVPAYDYHNPMYLAHTSDVVGSNVNQNTGAGQRDANAFTSNMRSNASRYAFEFNPDRDCIVIGISYYDIPRVYTNAIERQNFVLDRFDMFNPFLQYVGDQAIYRAEIGSRDGSLVPFGYCNHDMQYKQRFNQAAGAFANPVTGLDNWIFVSDTLSRQNVTNISPSFIRSFNCELDHFYSQLTGYSNGSYFHFIVRYDNRQDATRPMAYAPVIA